MLDPEYLQEITDGSVDIADGLHTDIITRIVERIMHRLGRGDDYILTQTDRWQIDVLQDAGYLLESITADISKYTKLQQAEIKAAMEDAGVKAISYDDQVYKAAGLSPKALLQSPQQIRLMQRNYEATLGTWKNFTRTTAQEAQKLFINECDKAYHMVSSGALSYTQAVKDAVNTAISDGGMVSYPTGHTDTIETATMRAVRTGVAQATGDIQMQRMIEMDWDIILVSSHLGARTGNGEDNAENHSWWQGKFYSRTGKDERFLPFSVTGYGTAEGLCGINCRHSFGPGDGENNPFRQYDSEENKKAYDLSQKQRALERRVRKTKREVAALQTAVDNCGDEKLKFELQQQLDKKSYLLKQQNERYNSFCEENELKPYRERLQIAKWDREKAAKAAGAARRYENTAEAAADDLEIKGKEEVAKVRDSGIININSAKAIDSFRLSVSDDKAKFTREEILGEMQESVVGKTTIEHIQDSEAVINMINEAQPHSIRGYQQGNDIKIFLSNIASKRIVAQTVIHEMTHYWYKIGACQHAEAICFAMEKMHILNRDYLTTEEWEQMVKLAVDNYPELEWEAGGYGDYEQFKFVRTKTD